MFRLLVVTLELVMIVSHIDMMKCDNSDTKNEMVRTKSDFVVHDFGMEFLACVETIQEKTKWITNKI